MVSRWLLELRRVCILVLVAGSLASCADGAGEPAGKLSLAGKDAVRVYRLGVGDKVKLGVYGEPDLSGQFEVNGAGMIAVPLVGEIPAKGLSITEFRENVQRKLATGYVKSPKVSVEIVSYRPIYVHGEVKTGGEFAFKQGTRLRDAVAMAGGYTYRAEQGYVLVMREGETSEMRVRLPSDVLVQPGDNIRVPERFF